MKLPESDVKKWKSQSTNPEAILVPRFVDPDTGKPLYVHRKGSNVKNGTYYIDQNIENTIAHYNSATFVNPGELRRRYEEVKKPSCIRIGEEFTFAAGSFGSFT